MPAPGWKGFAPGDRVTVRPLDPCGDCPACRAGHSHICQNLKFIGIDSPGALQGSGPCPRIRSTICPARSACSRARWSSPSPSPVMTCAWAPWPRANMWWCWAAAPSACWWRWWRRGKGARVVISEVNPFRLDLAREFGLEAVNPLETDLPKKVTEETGTAGADVVFEVSGSAAGAEMMTKLPRTRGRIVVVAIFGEAPKVDLFRFFWRELKLCGARVYEPQDFEEAIALAASGTLPLDRIVTGVRPLDGLADAMHQLEGGGPVMKILVQCAED